MKYSPLTASYYLRPSVIDKFQDLIFRQCVDIQSTLNEALEYALHALMEVGAKDLYIAHDSENDVSYIKCGDFTYFKAGVKKDGPHLAIYAEWVFEEQQE